MTGGNAEDGTAVVRPYAVVRGRTRVSSALALESLVGAADDVPVAGLAPEAGHIVELVRGTFVSVAELGALLELPVGVVRVLVDDLRRTGLVRIHDTAPSAAGELGLLGRVLDGICAL